MNQRGKPRVESTNRSRPGLREDKKRRTEAEILANAIQHFRERGVRGARLSEVARASRVSPATLFNYFPNKGALAEAWVRGEIDDQIENRSRELGDGGLRSTLRKLCRELSGLVCQDPGVRLEAWREAGRARIRPLSARHPFVVALAREQERERVREDISAQVLGEMLVDAIEGGVMAGLMQGIEQGELAKTLRLRVDLILDGARKKNERVEPPAFTSGSTFRG